MSRFQFIASDHPLIEVRNPYIELISINTALTRGMTIQDFILSDPEIDRDNTNMMLLCDTEEHMYEIEIEQVGEERARYTRPYTQKMYASELRWMYTEERAKQLLAYLNAHFRESTEIELWDTWMEDDQKPVMNYCTQKELSVEDLKDVFGKFEFHSPECIIVKFED